MFRYYLVLCCFSLMGISWVMGQGQFMCPTALTGVSDLSKFPCGVGNFQRSVAESSILEIQPGPFTITWQDPAPQTGSSYRVTLRSSTTADDYCILQDRIPSAPCSNSSGTGDNCTTPVIYRVTVNIPNIKCSHCFIQVATISPNGSDCLVSYDSQTAECPTFFTCTIIKIRSATGGSFRQCEANFFNKTKSWPFKAINPRQNFSVDFRDFPDIFPFAEGTFVYEIVFGVRGLVKYQVDLWLGPDILLYETSIVWQSLSGEWIKYRPLRMTAHGSYKGAMGVFSRPLDALLNSEWHIAVKHKYQQMKDAPFNITYVPVIKSAEIYSDMTGNYTSEGWLTGPDFDGPDASLTEVITPVGSCVPETSTVKPAHITTVQNDTPVSTKSQNDTMVSTKSQSDTPVPTKSHPDKDLKKPQNNKKPVNLGAQRTRFLYVKSGSDGLLSTRSRTIFSTLTILVSFLMI